MRNRVAVSTPTMSPNNDKSFSDWLLNDEEHNITTDTMAMFQCSYASNSCNGSTPTTLHRSIQADPLPLTQSPSLCYLLCFRAPVCPYPSSSALSLVCLSSTGKWVIICVIVAVAAVLLICAAVAKRNRLISPMNWPVCGMVQSHGEWEKCNCCTEMWPNSDIEKENLHIVLLFPFNFENILCYFKSGI